MRKGNSFIDVHHKAPASRRGVRAVMMLPVFLLACAGILIDTVRGASRDTMHAAATDETISDTSSTTGSGLANAHEATRPYVARAGISQTIGTPETPFWLQSNRDGLIPLHSGNNLLLFGEYHRSFLRDTHLADLDAGLRFDGRLSDGGNRLGFGELYVHFRISGWQLSAGRFHETLGLAPEYLSTGSMLMSRNAVQPFKIRLSTPDFLPVPLTGGVLSFKARWSEGLLTDERWVEGARVHQKYLYLKVRPVRNLDLVGGIVHNLMWGGRSPELGRLHGSFIDWLRDAAGQPDRSLFVNETPAGNGLGGYDFGIEYGTDTWSAGMYRLFFIEDGQSMHLPNPWDGTWNVFLDLHDPSRPNRLVSYVTYEHVNTKKQDAGRFDALGRGRYYSHYVYRDGWVHHGQTLGTPLILIDPDLMGVRERILVNNIILAHHLGVSGNFGERLSYELMATYSRNYGICHDQNSGGGCNGSAENPMQERETYVPFRDLRRDRYSFLLRISAPVSLLKQRLLGGTPAAVDDGRPDTQTHGPAHRNVPGMPAAGHSGGLRVHLAAALDAGAFHARPLLGFELGFTLPMQRPARSR